MSKLTEWVIKLTENTPETRAEIFKWSNIALQRLENPRVIFKTDGSVSIIDPGYNEVKGRDIFYVLPCEDVVGGLITYPYPKEGGRKVQGFLKDCLDDYIFPTLAKYAE